MTKTILKLGYTNYVLEADDAMLVTRILANAERYESKYRSSDDGGTLYYIWEPRTNDDTELTIRPISDGLYRMAKLAGEPTKDFD